MKNKATIKSVVPLRLNRSELAVPGSRPEIFEKAAESNSDAIFLDLEDSVSMGGAAALKAASYLRKIGLLAA